MKLNPKKSFKEKDSDDSDKDQKNVERETRQVAKPAPVLKQLAEKDITASEDEDQKGAIMKPDKPQKKPRAEKNPPEDELNAFVGMVVARPQDLNLKDRKGFLLSPPPKGKMIQCTVHRDKSGIAKKMCPEYHAYLSNTDIHIMSGKKTGWMKSSNYFIGHGKTNFERGADHLVAKLKASFGGTQFNIFDIGLNPGKSKNPAEFRCDLGVVTYVEMYNSRKKTFLV